MNFDYLFYQELPKGIKSVYVNGKRMSIKQFEEARKNFFLKSKGIKKSNKILKN